MEEADSTKQRAFHRYGERIGFGILVVFAIFFLSFQEAEQARSEEITQAPIPTAEILAENQSTPNQELIAYPQISEQSAFDTPTPTPTKATDEPTSTKIQAKSQTLPTTTESVQSVTPTATAQPTPSPTPSPTPPPAAPALDTSSDTVWDEIAKCESGGNWAIDTGNGYFGGLQFSQGAWESVGGAGNPAHAPREEQIMRGKMLKDRRGGFSAWGMCAVKLNLP